MIKIRGVNPILDIDKKAVCAYCEYLDGEVGCARVYRASSGRTKININDPFSMGCKSFSPAFKCEDCVYFKIEKLDEAYGGRTEKVTCTKRFVDDVEVTLCEHYMPKEEIEKRLRDTFEKFGFDFEIEG